MKKLLFLITPPLIVFGFSISLSAAAGTGDNVSGWAWSENIGWISFNSLNCDVDGDGTYEGSNEGGGATPAPAGCPTSGAVKPYGVNIAASGSFSGYAWSENIGWINFAPSGPYPSTPNYSVCVDLPGSGQACDRVGNFKVSGWARALAYDGGWDGWIKLRGTNYGVEIQQATGQFQGWAWSDMVIGWINFKGVAQNGAPYGYGVTTSFSFNQRPARPEKVGEGEVWNHCSFKGKSIPTFQWIYSDPEGDPIEGYEIWVGHTAGFSVPYFNHVVNIGATSYTLDLSQDDDSDWITELAWNTTYNWKVRVTDDFSNPNHWSDWSSPDVFKTPKHAYPWSDFNWTPVKPSQGEVVIFNPDLSEAFGGTLISSYLWTITEGTGNYVDDTNNTSQYPHIIFSTKTNKVKLEVTDSDGYSCTGVVKEITARLPLPEYKEVPPLLWLKKIFAAAAEFFNGFLSLR